MKIEPSYIAGGSLIEGDAVGVRAVVDEVAAAPAPASSPTENVMSYEDLLPYLLLPMAGAY